jgi:hypothetical protein
MVGEYGALRAKQSGNGFRASSAGKSSKVDSRWLSSFMALLV